MTKDRDLLLGCAAASVGLGLLFAIGAASFDFPCLPGFAETGLADDLSKGQALIAAARFGLTHPSVMLPAFLGFSLILFASMTVPMLAAEKSNARLLMGLALAPLILGTTAWIVLTGPGSDCAAENIAFRLLKGVAFGAVGLYGAAWVWGRYKDRA